MLQGCRLRVGELSLEPFFRGSFQTGQRAGPEPIIDSTAAPGASQRVVEVLTAGDGTRIDVGVEHWDLLGFVLNGDFVMFF